MYLAPEGDELEISAAAQQFLAAALPLERLRGGGSGDLPREVRASLGALGWFGLSLGEVQGGSGLGEVEHVLFFREVGRLCGPLDILAQCLAARMAGDESLRASLLAGEAGCCLAIADGAHYRLLGSEDARFAVSVSEDAAALHAIDGLDLAARPSLDPVQSMRVCAGLGERLAAAETADLWRMGQLACAAMLVGIAETALDLIVDYAKVRETFGKKIGSWQAVRHPCADMAVRLEAARAQLWFAAAACNEARGDAGAHLIAAKHLASEAARLNADSAIQLHGGIGVTEEHAAHVLLKHALVLARLFGGSRALLDDLLTARLEA